MFLEGLLYGTDDNGGLGFGSPNPALFVGGSGASFPSDVAVADVNGDGLLDIVVSEQLSNTVAVFLNQGHGVFSTATPLNFTIGNSPGYNTPDVQLAVGDVNGDGKPDIVTANGDNTISLLVGKGDGTFQPFVTVASGLGCCLQSIALARLRGPGSPLDILAGTVVPGHGDSVDVLLGNGNGTFQPPVPYHTGTYGGVTQIVVGDMNGDGIPDVIALNGANDSNDTDEASILTGNGDGTLNAPGAAVTVPIGSDGAVAVADLNGDGQPDLVFADSHANEISVYLNTTTIPTKLAAGALLNPAYPAYTANAVLIQKQGGQPIAGATIVFTTGTTPICTAVTNPQGLAKCTNLKVANAETANHGYTAGYAGTNYNLPATAKGALK